jgi:formamidopyrimidine-DNA glycosylase
MAPPPAWPYVASMPELPEVETVRRGLAPHLEGARLARVEQNRPDLRFPLPEDFVARLTGATIEALERRAKYLLARLDTGETLVAHLGMTGRFTVEEKAAGRFHHPAGADPKHTHVVFETDKGTRIAYNDARRFGFMALIPTARLAEHPWFAGMGPEPLGPAFTPGALAAALAGRRQNIKVTLLVQRVVAGLGNIYVSEALHLAGISPERPAGEVTAKEIGKLVPAIRTTLEAAIQAGGSSLRDYRQADGGLGYFQHSFRVYDREEHPCPTRACKGQVRRMVQAGRSTFFCPVCQP